MDVEMNEDEVKTLMIGITREIDQLLMMPYSTDVVLDEIERKAERIVSLVDKIRDERRWADAQRKDAEFEARGY